MTGGCDVGLTVDVGRCMQVFVREDHKEDYFRRPQDFPWWLEVSSSQPQGVAWRGR